MLEKKDWWFGPDFLWTDFDSQFDKVEEHNAIAAVCPEDPEVRKSSVLTTKVCEWAGIEERLNRFSSWHRTKRAIAICLRYRKILLARVRETVSPASQSGSASKGSSKTISANPLNVDELNDARKEIIWIVQQMVS